jgi:hypothetical protein
MGSFRGLVSVLNNTQTGLVPDNPFPENHQMIQWRAYNNPFIIYQRYLSARCCASCWEERRRYMPCFKKLSSVGEIIHGYE